VLLILFIAFYSSNISKGYYYKLVKLSNEKYIKLLALSGVFYLVYIKKITVALLYSVIVLFFYLNTPVLTESFIDINMIDDIAKGFPEKTKKLYNKINKMKDKDLAEMFNDNYFENMDNDIKNVKSFIKQLEEKNESLE
jgi:hypothetical protein